MSLAFNDTSLFKGIVQIYEREIRLNQGDISGDATKLKKFTADANLALDDFFALAIPASGTWQLDDSNQTDYPIISTDLISGQRDYAFTTDSSSNLILDIYKVMVATSAGIFSEIYPVDVQSQINTQSFWSGQDVGGIPNRYDKTANAIFLDPIPNYNATGGLKVYVNREGSYFTSTDTTRKPGVPGLFHKYFALKPAMDYARIKSLANYPQLVIEVSKMEKAIEDYYASRSKDEIKRVRPITRSFR